MDLESGVDLEAAAPEGEMRHGLQAPERNGARPAPPDALIAFVLSSNSGFTPTISGAIATCIWNVVQVPCANIRRPVLALSVGAAPYPYDDLHIVRPRQFASNRGPFARALRRLTGWREGQHAYARAALGRLRSLRPDAVICNNDAQIAAYLARKLPKARIVHWLHGPLVVPRDARWRRRYWRASLCGRVVNVAVSNYMARAVEHSYPLRPLSVVTVLNGVDCQQFRPRPDRRCAAECAPTVAFLGRVTVEKGLDVLLRSVSSLAAKGVDFQLLIIGDTNWGYNDGGPYGRTIGSLVGQLRARGVQVVQAGHIPRAELPDMLREVDIQVVSSRIDEGCPLVILEGMASGLPIIATATGGTPEVLSGTGVLVPREDEEALAAALEQLIIDREARRRLGQAARRRAEGLTWAATWSALGAAALGMDASESSDTSELTEIS